MACRRVKLTVNDRTPVEEQQPSRVAPTDPTSTNSSHYFG